MAIRPILLAAALSLTTLGAVQADNARPSAAHSIDLGAVSGVAYYTVERDGFRVVTTLAQGDAGAPVRVVAVLAPGQRVVLSTSRDTGSTPVAVEISRQADTLLVRTMADAMN